MEKEKKAFKDTLFGKIVNKAAHVIPDVAGIALQAATGDIKGAIQNLKGQLIDASLGGSIKAQPILTELDLQMAQIELEFARVQLEETIVKEENVTKRWEADMHSDSWLSKNARPIGFFWALVMVTIINICSFCEVEVSDGVLTLSNTIIGTIIGGYFILRTVEKRNDKKYNSL